MKETQHMLRTKNIDKVEKLFVSQLLLLLPFAQHRSKVQKDSMTFPSHFLKESVANWSGTPHGWGPFPGNKTVYPFNVV